MHVTSQEDIEQEAAMKKEEERVETIMKNQKVSQRLEGKSMHDCDEVYKYDQITYLQDFKRNTNFSYIQSIVLIAAFLAGSNKESGDIKMFEIDKSKSRTKNI